MKIKEINIGIVKAVFDREMTYISRFNFLMIAYLFFKDIGFEWWYLFAIPLFLIWVYIDLKYIMPRELFYLNRKSPFLRQILKNTEKNDS